MCPFFSAPECILIAFAVGLILIEALWPKISPCVIASFSMLGTLLALLTALRMHAVMAGGCEGPMDYYVPIYCFGSQYRIDGLSTFFKVFSLVVTAIVIGMARAYQSQIPSGKSEFYTLPLITTAGLCLMASAYNLLLLFVALELMTISFYILIGYQRNRLISLEAGLKYLILGGLSTAFLIYAIALISIWSGGTDFEIVGRALATEWAANRGIICLSMALLLAAIGFKIAAVPFHIWAPDVYQGAPTPITAFLSTASKAAGFLILIRAFRLSDTLLANLDTMPIVEYLFGWLAAFSMILGSFGALAQRNIKRLLGYSSIANTGFILMALTGWSTFGVESALLYLILYAMALLLVFSILSISREFMETDDTRSYAGLGRRSPLLALALTVGLVSLAGIPPLAGFWGKWYVLYTGWQAGAGWLVGIALVSAGAGLYYYLSVVRSIWWFEPHEVKPITLGALSRCILMAWIAALLLFGFWQQPLLQVVQKACRNLAIEPGS